MPAFAGTHDFAVERRPRKSWMPGSVGHDVVGEGSGSETHSAASLRPPYTSSDRPAESFVIRNGSFQSKVR